MNVFHHESTYPRRLPCCKSNNVHRSNRPPYIELQLSGFLHKRRLDNGIFSFVKKIPGSCHTGINVPVIPRPGPTDIQFIVAKYGMDLARLDPERVFFRIK